MSADTCDAKFATRVREHVCNRSAGHPLSGSVWEKNAETHQCDGFQWLDLADGATPATNQSVRGSE